MFLFWIFIIVFCYLLYANERFRFTVFHFPTVFYNAFCDFFKFIKFRDWHNCKDYGKMEIYTADEKQPFGSGKTLNMVRSVRNFYHLYNDKEVFDFEELCFVNQYVHIYSNIKLFGVPYVPLKNTQQFIDVANGSVVPEGDKNHHIFVFCFDELGTLFNNRDWKNNLSTDFLSALLQQRKNRVLIFGTVQDFSLFDATMRKICTNVYVCSKKWRFLTIRQYFAKDIERAGFNTQLLQLRGLSVRFATDALYNSYDTNELIQGIQKGVQQGEYLSNKEVLEQASNDSDIRSLTAVKRQLKRHVRG